MTFIKFTDSDGSSLIVSSGEIVSVNAEDEATCLTLSNGSQFMLCESVDDVWSML
ncbi:MAG: hypothetical protein M3R04_08085 [bacterium]|nr:hypothetical protein [bacterium]